MLIGIDASRAIALEPTGTENYSRQLITALLRLPTQDRFRLYTRSLPPPGLFGESERYENRTIPFPRFWTHIRLSTEMALHPPDVLFVPAHVIPLFYPNRVAVTIHDLGYLHFPDAHPRGDRLYLHASTRWNVDVARKIFTTSQSTATDIQRFYGVQRDKIFVTGAAYDATRFTWPINVRSIQTVQSRYGLNGKYLLTVGSLQPRKNYERLLRSFAGIRVPIQLVIAGRKGWMFEGIFDAIKSLELTGRVKYLEYVRAEDLAGLYGGAAGLVFPSLYEGFGFPVLEAQACGTPVICSNTSSLPEVADGAALFVDPLSVDSICDAIQRLLSDESLRRELVAKGLENVKRFSWEHVAKSVHQELSNIK